MSRISIAPIDSSLRARPTAMTALPCFTGPRAVLILVACAAGLPCHAAQSVLSETLDDAKLYFTAPLRWDERDWAWFGGSLLAIGAAHEYDDNVYRHFGTVQNPGSTNPDPHDSRDWVPAAAIVGLTWAYAT